MNKAILGKKIGMTQIFLSDGRLAPVTVVEAGPCVVTQIKTVNTDGYEAVQVGFGELAEQRAKKLKTKPELGHFAKVNVPAKRYLKEFRFEDISSYNVGDVASVKVLKFMPFGAFAEIIPGVDGLIHISQIANRRIAKPDDVLTEGETVDAKITDIDTEKKKVSLSIRALLETAEEAEEAAEEATEE